MQRPELPEELRKIAQTFHTSDVEPILAKRRGAITGWLNKTLGNDTNRKLVLAYLFTPSLEEPARLWSSKELTEGDWFTLDMILDTYQDEETGVWYCHPAWDTERLLLMGMANQYWYRWYPDPPNAEAFKNVPLVEEQRMSSRDETPERATLPSDRVVSAVPNPDSRPMGKLPRLKVGTI